MSTKVKITVANRHEPDQALVGEGTLAEAIAQVIAFDVANCHESALTLLGRIGEAADDMLLRGGVGEAEYIDMDAASSYEVTIVEVSE